MQRKETTTRTITYTLSAEEVYDILVNGAVNKKGGGKYPGFSEHTRLMFLDDGSVDLITDFAEPVK